MVNNPTIISKIKEALRHGNVLLTGPSGVGKSKVLDELKTILGPDIMYVNLDLFGKRINDKWLITNPTTGVKGILYEGTPDFDTKTRDSLNLKMIVLPIPPLNVYHSIQLAKAREGKEKNLPSAWIQGWQKRADYTLQQMEDDITATLLMGGLSELNNVSIVRLRHSSDGEVVHGWHKSKTETAKTE